MSSLRENSGNKAHNETRARSNSSGTNPRPFYELPEHIKPCSKIIQETREELEMRRNWGRSSIGSGTGGFGVSIHEATIREGIPRSSSLQESLSGSVDFSAHHHRDRGIGGMGGVRPVNTSRPFTPMVSSSGPSFWGVSSRKRPPSAITLSRLSLDNIYENGPEKQEKYNGTESEMEKIRLKFKGLSTTTRRKYSEEDSEQHGNEELLHLKASQSSGSESGEGGMNTINPVEKINICLNHVKTYIESSDKTKSLKPNLLSHLSELKSLIPCLSVHAKEGFQNTVKTKIIRCIFKLVEKDSQDEDILFWSSFILLHCQIIGNNLTTVFKMVYKSIRSKTYASVIKDSEYLDVFMYSLGQICPITQTESMIYGYGTLRFICTDECILEKVLSLNIISVMELHMKILNSTIMSTDGKKALAHAVTENIQNGVFQLTSVLRCLVGVETSLEPLVAGGGGLLEELCNSLPWTVNDIDVVTNVVRIFSVVSGNFGCSEVLSVNSTLPSAIVRILKIYHAKEDIIVRLTYCLGNLLGRNEDMRRKLYDQPLAYQMIIQLIGYWLEHQQSNGGSDDILVKSIRILANWSLNSEIGSEICDHPDLCTLLNSILEAAIPTLESGEKPEVEVSNELLICTISTLNNISFYKDYQNLGEPNLQTAECLYKFLTLKNLDIRTEAMKVLGNLTRNEMVRAGAVENIGIIMTSLFLDSMEKATLEVELLCATIGVLMNIIVEEKARVDFIRLKGFPAILSLLEDHSDFVLNIMTCQFIWNLLVSSLHNSKPIISASENSELVELLYRKLEETKEAAGENIYEGDEASRIAELAADLSSLIQTLLEKLKSFQTSFQ